MLRFLVCGLADEEVEALHRAAPGVELLVTATPEEALARVPEADALYGCIVPEVIAAGKKLRWVQAGYAGVERILFPELRDSEIVLTNAQAIYAPSLADHTMAMMLAFARGLPTFVRAQEKDAWRHDEVPGLVELGGQTLLVVGLGSTGRELARRAAAFGMRILGTRRRPGPPPRGVEAVFPTGDLCRLLPEADYVAICAPLTTETQGLFGPEEFRRMKHSAILTNVARGAVVRTDALVEALRAGEIAGAGLDVTDPEPLPAGHPLWAMENVLITPHVAGSSQSSRRRLIELVSENLRRFAAGEPLRYVVDKQAGY